MGKMLSRAVRATIFDRRAYTEAFFDEDSAADGAILYALVGAVVYLGGLIRVGGLRFVNVGDLLGVVIAMLVGWLILAVATWFVVSRLFGSTLRRPQIMIGLHGLAPLPLLLEILGRTAGGLLSGAGLVWHLAILTMATREAASIDLRRSAVSVLIGFGLVLLFRALLNIPFALFGL